MLSTNLQRDPAVKDVLHVGEALYCENGQFRLIVLDEGVARIELLQERKHPTTVWQTGETDISGPYRFQLQPNGEAVVYGAGNERIWCTGTAYVVL